MSTCIGLRDGGGGVQLKGRIVVDIAVLIDDSTMPVVGVFVDTEIRNEHNIVADICPQLFKCDLSDAVGCTR